MGNFGGGEFITIAIVALLIFGPKRLPEIGRNVGKALAQLRKATNELKEGFNLGFEEDEPLFLTGPTKPTRRVTAEAPAAIPTATAPAEPATPAPPPPMAGAAGADDAAER
jgi:TatA/E family protein of Tat protein translocase